MMSNKDVLVAALKMSASQVREFAQGDAAARLGLYSEGELMVLTKALYEVAATLDDEAEVLASIGRSRGEPPLGIPE